MPFSTQNELAKNWLKLLTISLLGAYPQEKPRQGCPKKFPGIFLAHFFARKKNRRPLTRIFLSGYNAPKEIVRAKILPFGNSQFQFFGNGIQAIPFSGPNFRSPQNELAVVPRPLCSKQVPRTDFEQAQNHGAPRRAHLYTTCRGGTVLLAERLFLGLGRDLALAFLLPIFGNVRNAEVRITKNAPQTFTVCLCR